MSLFTVIKALFASSKVDSITKQKHSQSRDALLHELEEESSLEKRFIMLLEHVITFSTEKNQPFFIYTFDSEKNYYIQVMGGENDVTCELVGNEYLSEENKLHLTQVKQLQDLGWEEDGNFIKSWSIHDELALKEIADVLVNAMAIYSYDKQSKPKINIEI